jgi:DegV family protein with EDD domain
MPQICILTDPAALFEDLSFPGSEFIYVVNGTPDKPISRINTLPSRGLADQQSLHNYTPSTNTFRMAFADLARQYNEILVILSSAQINSNLYAHAQQAAESFQGRVSIQIIDSQTFGPGVGQIVQTAAAIAANNPSGSEVYRQTQIYIGHIYTVFCTRALKQLSVQGKFDPEHAFLSEMLGIAPLLIIENGQIVSTQKARNSRHLVELFMEYLEEFYSLQRIYIFQSEPVFGTELNQVRERINTMLTEVEVRQILDIPVIQASFGPACIGMIVLDR